MGLEMGSSNTGVLYQAYNKESVLGVEPASKPMGKTEEPERGGPRSDAVGGALRDA